MNSLTDDFDEDDGGIDLTPLIDVIFMMLIFFIVATTFVKPSFEVNLPDADSAKIVDEEEKKTVCAVTVDAEGRVFFDGNEIAPDALEAEFTERKDQIFQVFADRAAPFGSIMALMDAARKQGNEHLVFMVEKAQ